MKFTDRFHVAIPHTARPNVSRFGISAEVIGPHYTLQADDHSLTDEHEIEYDIVAGV